MPASPKQPRVPPESQEPLQFKFRTKPVQERSIFESWAVLPAKTRLRVSLALTAFAATGIYISDKLEQFLPPEAPSSKPSSS